MNQTNDVQSFVPLVYSQVALTRLYLESFRRGVLLEFLPNANQVYLDWRESSRGLTFLMGPIFELIEREWEAKPSSEMEYQLRANMSRLQIVHECLTDTFSAYCISSTFESARRDLAGNVAKAVRLCDKWKSRLADNWQSGRLQSDVVRLLSSDPRFRSAFLGGQEWGSQSQIQLSDRDKESVASLTDLEHAIIAVHEGLKHLKAASKGDLLSETLEENPLLGVCMATRALCRTAYFLMITRKERISLETSEKCCQALELSLKEADTHSKAYSTGDFSLVTKCVALLRRRHTAVRSLCSLAGHAVTHSGGGSSITINSSADRCAIEGFAITKLVNAELTAEGERTAEQTAYLEAA